MENKYKIFFFFLIVSNMSKRNFPLGYTNYSGSSSSPKRGGGNCTTQPGGGSRRRKATRRVSGKGRGRRTSMLRMKKRMSKRRGSKAKSRSRSRSKSRSRSRQQRGGLGCQAIQNAPEMAQECSMHAIDETRCLLTQGCEFIR